MTSPERGAFAAVPPQAAVVIVNHNTRSHLRACLDTLADAGAAEVVVVDAGSVDGSGDAVRDEHPEATLLELANIGYGRAANAGVARTRAPFVVVANADTRFAPGAIAELVSVLDRDDAVGAVGPRVRYPDGRLQASARRFPTLPQAAGHAVLGLWWPRNRWTRAYRMLDDDPTLAKDVDWLSGCALALRRQAFDDVGGFDPGYFMFVEDVDLGYRLREEGWKVRFHPAAVVTHEVGASTRGSRSAMVREHARSLDRFYGRVYGDGVGRFLRPLIRVGLRCWVALVLTWHWIVARRTGRSTTGE